MSFISRLAKAVMRMQEFRFQARNTVCVGFGRDE